MSYLCLRAEQFLLLFLRIVPFVVESWWIDDFCLIFAILIEDDDLFISLKLHGYQIYY